MEREVHYCTSADGTRIGYTVFGQGPALIQCPALWVSMDNPYPWMAEPHSQLHSGRTVVQYDLRGVGLSQREVSDFTLDRMIEDIEAVAAAAGLDRFALYGSQISASPAVLLAVHHPRQVTRLLLTRPFFKGSDLMSPETLDGMVALIQSNWEMGSQMIADQGIRGGADPTAGIKAAELLRLNMSADALARMLTDLYRTADVKAVLPDIQCPTLMVQRREDTLVSFSTVQEAAAAIPGARLLPLPGSGPVDIGEDPTSAFRAMAAFLNEDPETSALTGEPTKKAPDSSFRTVLFTDIVGHTEMMSRLGDAKGRDVLREHERITREALAAHGGDEVKTMGDGFMASFGSVTKAVECAIALQRAFAERESDEPLSVRVGINAGEPIEEDGDLFGATVILASRIAAKAEGGGILVADTVRGLCSGKGFVFADRGEFVAKGFEDAVRVYGVSWHA